MSDRALEKCYSACMMALTGITLHFSVCDGDSCRVEWTRGVFFVSCLLVFEQHDVTCEESLKEPL